MSLSASSRRRTVSAVSSPDPHDIDIGRLIDDLRNVKEKSYSEYVEALQDTTALPQLRHILKEDDNDEGKVSKNALRRVGGFQVLIDLIQCLAKRFAATEPVDAPVKHFLQTLDQILVVLSVGLENHPGNQKYFRTRLNENGWDHLQTALSIVRQRLGKEDDKSMAMEHFFGLLLAAAAGSEVVSDIYVLVTKAIAAKSPISTGQQTNPSAIYFDTIQKTLSGTTSLMLPEMLKVLMAVWIDRYAELARDTTPIDLAIPLSLKCLLSSSKQNLVSAHLSGISSTILPLLFDDRLSLEERSLYKDIALQLLQDGISNLDEAQNLFLQASTKTEAASFLLQAIKMSNQPSRIEFDLAGTGYASAELSSLGKPFPPSDTAGYTLSLWAYFNELETNAHTTLFGAFDRTQSCFVLAYLEKGSHHLILQTAIRGTKPSIRFKSIAFQPGHWYHICLVQKRPRTTSASRAYLFVNGDFMEQQKATYPSYPPVDRGHGPATVQAFFGTPQDLSPSPAESLGVSKWSLASATLFQDALGDDLISVFYHLGPHYHGNFQDCLGSFQTYHASAALNLRNETLHSGKEDHSELIVAIRQKASNLIREDGILLNISPASVLDSDDRNNIDESQLIKSLSKLAAKNLAAYTRSGSNAIAINGAVPAINDALTQARGVAMLMGNPLVSVPQSLDEAAWRLGGCAPVGLGLVSRAVTTEDVALSVNILFETIRHNWRNSEIMERERGYEILAMLLREKLAQPNTGGDTHKPTFALPTSALDRMSLMFQLLRAILEFVGYNFEDRDKSVINNPLAYKVLLVDCNIWRCGSSAVQELYFEQFLGFAAESQHVRFNLKRLTRMRVSKRLLEALKSENVTKATMQMYIQTFRVLLPPTMSAELLRSLALFVTFCVNKRNLPLQFRKSTRREPRPRHASTLTSHSPKEEANVHLTSFEIGVEILKLYCELLFKPGDQSMIKKFAKTVTNKWLLYLLSETSPEVVVLSMRILARLLVVHGDAYVKKFKEKTGGFKILCHRLKRWWHLPALWPACFAILFNLDIAKLDLDRNFDLFGFIDLFNAKKELSVVYPEMLEPITGMLQSGIKAIVSSKQHSKGSTLVPPVEDTSRQAPERLSMSTMAPPNPLLTIVTGQHIDTLATVIRFLSDLHSRSQKFRDFASSSIYVQDLLSVLFPVVVGSDIVEAITELDARDSTLTFDGADVVVQPLSSAQPVIRTSKVDSPSIISRGKALRRGSSYILVSRDKPQRSPSPSRLHQVISPSSSVPKIPDLNEGHALVQDLLEIIVAIFLDQILVRKDFAGLGLFLRTPPGFIEHQTYFESWLLRNTVSQLSNTIAMNQRVLTEPKVLTNLARLFLHLGEALFEGWFIGGADSVLDLSGSVLEYLQRSDIAAMKSVRLCTQAVTVIRAVVFRTVLLSLSEIQDSDTPMVFLDKLAYWQTVLLSAEETQSNYLQLVCYLLYASLVASQETVRMTAANLWRIILVQKPDEAAAIFGQAETSEHKQLISSFEKLVELDNETFLYWVDEHRSALDALFFDTLSRSWDNFVLEENKKTEESARSRIMRRREKLKQWAREGYERDELIRRHEITFEHWTANIYTSEYLKHQRLLQDQQDDLVFTENNLTRMQRDTSRPAGLFATPKPRKWRLDQTEGRNRMRMRLHEDFTKQQEETQPRRKGTDVPSLQLDTSSARLSSSEAIGITPGGATPLHESPKTAEPSTEPFPEVQENGEEREHAENGSPAEADDSFELIEDPNEALEEFEDKNRKVMRSLHRGDQVKHVANISRILGLEAVEGLLILGKDYIYLIDNFFQRADGEIVNVWQAPMDERDSYVRMISGRDVIIRKAVSRNEEHECRSWKWSDVISVSKRRFLFRDVAIEIFFGDGRSYLLTVMSPQTRNELHSLINAKAPQFGASDSPQSETAWRYETLKSVEDEPQTLGSRFANVFNQTPTMSATKKWQKGDLSNFHYLMLVNTLAGRTYNDLTQYPVFPWVIADYTSEELDLTDPRSFRDLAKPMGCQTPNREAEFRERYKSFAEMGDHNAPAFHYGTHYSSAMIVTSYLIRLQPFVKSYLLLQGGTFDHPDRMFFSIEQAWRSASRINMTDVRELTPEFFYLPEFLVNLNDFDFGTRQNSKKSIGSVELPPWAKGDPRIFIAKNREALESPHVSRNLHKWIDLVFGCKQKGDAAVEAVNVFHHLSYQGARDLDTITDPVERLATIGIIHNFGQTPYQVFSKAHPARDQIRHKYRRLDTAAESLTRLPSTLLESEERVASLTFSWKSDKLLCSGAFRLNMPPNFDTYMEWGFSDNSVRFYSAESRKLIGLFEHLHIGQLSCALFADSKTLITSGVDCTVAVWSLSGSSKAMDVQPRATLFGHRQPVNVLAMSRSFNALLSASSDGQLMLWDLNRCEFVRKIDDVLAVECAWINDVTGNIVLCHGSQISIYSINGDLILRQRSDDRVDDKILSCACYEGAGNEWLERDVIFTGHRRGVVKVWSKVIRNGRFELEQIRQLNHSDSSREDGGNVQAGISCILPMPQLIYTGDEDGRVPVNLDFDARVPIPISVFPSTYRSDAITEKTTETKVQGEVHLGGRGREDTRFGCEQVDINIRDNRPRQEKDIYIHEERDRFRDSKYPEVELAREKYQAPAETKHTNLDIEIDRRGSQDFIDVDYDRRQVFDRTHETQIDVTERDYRRRTDPTFDVEYERRRPEAEVVIEKKEVKRDMGYYDDDGNYHSFRRGVERVADRIAHPFGHRHHHHEDIVVEEKAEGPSRVREGVKETIRYIERPSAGANTVTIPCHFIRIGDLLMLQGRPCQVIRISMSASTGQYRYLGVDLFSRQLREESSFVSNPEPSVIVQSMLGPVFKQYRILDLSSDGSLVCMTETGDVKQGMNVVDQGNLYGKIERSFSEGRGSVRALVINDGGRELIVDYKVIHGSRL